MVGRAGGRWAALDRYGIYPVDSAVLQSSRGVWILTLCAFIFTYVMFIAFLTAAFALAAARRGRT
jgi:hypothetical protein